MRCQYASESEYVSKETIISLLDLICSTLIHRRQQVDGREFAVRGGILSSLSEITTAIGSM